MNFIGNAWSLVPSLIVLGLAIKSKRLLESILVGSIVAFIMLDGVMFWDGWIGALFTQLEHDSVIWVALTTFLLGAIINLVQKSGGSKSFTRLALKYSKTEKHSLLATIILGLIVFVDDYLNALSVSSAMKEVTDKFNVPREMLGYTVSAVGAPVSILVPFSSWGAYMIGLLGLLGYEYAGSAIATYVKAIPYMVYGYVAIAVALLVALGVIPKLGGMKAAFKRAESGQVHPERILERSDEDDMGKEPKIINFILPISGLVLGTIFIYGDLLYGLIVGIFVAMILYTMNGTMKYEECLEAMFEGAMHMLEVFTIVLFCYIFVEANTRLELAPYVIDSVKPYMSAALLPAISFAVIGILAFITGSFWELAALAFPIMLPLGDAIGADPYLVLASVVCGTVFGSTTCFYSDTNLLVSKGCEIDMMHMAPKILPYGIIAFFVSVVGYLGLGFIV